MRARYGALIIGVILAAVATLLLIALPGSANLTAAYVFCLIGIAIMVIGVWVTEDNSIFSYALLGQVAWFLPISLIISVIVLALQGMRVLTMPVVWHSILQIVPLAFAGIRIVAVYIGKHEIGKSDKKISANRNRLNAMTSAAEALQTTANALPENCRMTASKALKQVMESLRYADPVSAESVRELDLQIEAAVGGLKALCCAETVDRFAEECGRVCALIRERNRTLRMSKTGK